MTRREQYEICQQRGHEPSWLTLTCDPPLQVCRFCGTHYRWEKTLIESNVPPEDAGPDMLKFGDPL